MGDISNDIKSATIRCIVSERNVEFLSESLTYEEYILVNAYMQGLDIIYVGLEWISYKRKEFHVEFNVMFPDWCHH